MSDRSLHNKRIAKNTLFLYLRMGLVLIVSLFSTRVVLQALDIEDYGINNVVSGFVTMFAFLNTSMSNGFIIFLLEERMDTVLKMYIIQLSRYKVF